MLYSLQHVGTGQIGQNSYSDVVCGRLKVVTLGDRVVLLFEGVDEGCDKCVHGCLSKFAGHEIAPVRRVALR